MRALAPELRLWGHTGRNRPSFAACNGAEVLVVIKRVAGNNWKTVPQGLTHSPIAYSTARLKPCPSFRVFPQPVKPGRRPTKNHLLTWAGFRMETLALLQSFTNCPLQLGTSKTNDRLQSYMVGCPLRENDFADRVTYGTGCGRRSLSGARSIQD